ncbi:MAG: hypothetical protein WC222_00160 [Parachlamydiales bacterium]|jgi:hypothetical protein
MLLDIGINQNSGGGVIDDDYIKNNLPSLAESINADGKVQSDGSIKGSGQVDKDVAFKDSLSGAGENSGVGGKGTSHGTQVDSKVPSLPEGNNGTPPPGGKVDSYFTGPSIAFFAIVAEAMDQVKRLMQQIDAVDTKFQNTQNLESRESAKLARDQGYEAADDKRTGGLMALGIAVLSAVVQIGVAGAQASNLSKTQAAAKGGQDTGAVDANGTAVLTKPDDKAWDKGRMKSDNLSTVGQIASGLGSGASQGASGIYEASSMEHSADSQLTQDAAQAYSKGADAASQEKKEEQDTFSKALDGLADAIRKAKEAAAQLLKG